MAGRLAGLVLLASLGCKPATGLQLDHIERLEVVSARVDCAFVASGPWECLLVRWEHSKVWEPLGNGIQGFDFEPGYTYVLEVAVFEWRGPINPDQTWDHRLLRVLRKTPVPPG